VNICELWCCLRCGAVFKATDYVLFRLWTLWRSTNVWASSLGELHQSSVGIRCTSSWLGRPGHVPMQLIKENMTEQLELCPMRHLFYTINGARWTQDIAPGYDHINFLGLARPNGWYGCCYVVLRRHQKNILVLPRIERCKRSLITYKIAAHAAGFGERPSRCTNSWQRLV